MCIKFNTLFQFNCLGVHNWGVTEKHAEIINITFITSINMIFVNLYQSTLLKGSGILDQQEPWTWWVSFSVCRAVCADQATITLSLCSMSTSLSTSSLDSPLDILPVHLWSDICYSFRACNIIFEWPYDCRRCFYLNSFKVLFQHKNQHTHVHWSPNEIKKEHILLLVCQIYLILFISTMYWCHIHQHESFHLWFSM